MPEEQAGAILEQERQRNQVIEQVLNQAREQNQGVDQILGKLTQW